jgi:hypothetical protein
MSIYPGSGPSTTEVTPLLPALLFILSTRWLTRLVELYYLEVEEEEFDLPSLRVQAPLYRRGPGYSSVSGRPAVGSSMAAVLTWVRCPLAFCLGACYFIKCLFPLDQHLRRIWLLLCLGSFGGGEACPLVGGGRAWLAPRYFWQSVRWRVFVVFVGSVLRG